MFFMYSATGAVSMTFGQIFEFLFSCCGTLFCFIVELNPIKQVYFCSVSQEWFEKKLLHPQPHKQ